MGIFCEFFLLEMACLKEEEILEYLYSLPENDDDSEEECDEDAAEELTHLEITNSGCDESDGSFSVAVDISQEGTELDRQSNDTSEDESEWGDSVSYFERITRALDQLYVLTSLKKTQKWTIFYPFLQKKYWKLFRTRQISTQHRSARDDLEGR